MHVLYFHQHFTTPKGASGLRSYQMARALLANGHGVTMVCGSLSNGMTGLTAPFSKGRRSGVVDGINVIEFDLRYSNRDGFLKRSFTFLRYAIGSIRVAAIERYDLVFATSTPLTAAIPGIFARWFRRKPFVFEVRDLWPELPRQMGAITNPLILLMLSVLEKLSYVSADRCIALSPGISEGIAKRGVPLDRISIIPNGCDFDIFAQGDMMRWRPDGISETDFMTIFAGTHGQANGLDAVLDAARILKQRGRADIKILLIGDGKLKAQLVNRVATESLGNIVFHDPVDKARLAGLMSAADLGLQCLANIPAFYYGTSPNKFFDYIASGLPVLCNYPGWIADMITEHDCGFAILPDDASAFADALEKAADDRTALRQQGSNGAALAHDQFDRTKLAGQWLAWTTEGIKQ